MAAPGIEQPFATRRFQNDARLRFESIVPYLKTAMSLRLQVKAAGRTIDLGWRALDAPGIGVAPCSPERLPVITSPRPS